MSTPEQHAEIRRLYYGEPQYPSMWKTILSSWNFRGCQWPSAKTSI